MKAKMWFSKVSNAENISAYKLDRIFDQFPDRKNEDKLKMFVSVRKGCLPSTGNHRLRDFNLVEIVGKTEGYEESKAIFDSLFWELASDKARYINMHLFRDFATRCIELAYSSAMKTSTGQERYFYREMPLKFGQKKPKIIKVKIPDFLLTKASLDQLAAIGVLYREAYLSCSVRYSEDIKALYLEKLYEFLKEEWIADHLKPDFYALATKILCPIMQYSRNKMTSIYKKINSKHIDSDTKDFLKNHHEAARYDFYEKGKGKKVSGKNGKNLSKTTPDKSGYKLNKNSKVSFFS